MTYRTYDLLSKLSEASTSSNTWDVARDYFSTMGFEVINLGVVNRDNNSLAGFFSTMGDDWMSYYHDQQYGLVDPLVKQAFSDESDFIYTRENSHLMPSGVEPDAQKMFDEVAELGIRSSFLTPFHSSHAEYLLAFNLGTSLEATEFHRFLEGRKEEILVGAALAQGFTSKILENREDAKNWCPTEQDVTCLSAREIEVINWLANGLRTDRIAEKMNIANVTVNFHINSIKKKLNAKTREHAIANAFIQKIIR